MLSSLLGALQSALTSFTRGFLIVALLPVVCFAAINVSLLRIVAKPTFDAYVARVQVDSFDAVAAIVGLFVLALIVTSLQPILLELLAGESLPARVRQLLIRRQTDRLDVLKERAERAFAAKDRVEQRANGSGKADTSSWISWLDARRTDVALSGQTLVDIGALWDLRRQGDDISAEQIEQVMQAFKPGVAAPAAPTTPREVSGARLKMLRIIGYTRDRSRYRFSETQNRLQFNFPGDVFDLNPSSDNVLAPTRFGNIGRTMRSYGLRRYSMDLDIFWTRLQKVMADSQNSKMFDALQTQKTQVDFVVTVFWFSVLTGLLWIPWLAIDRQHPTLFRVVTVSFPLAAWLLYEAACRAYLLFADQVRTSVDFFRLDILHALRITDPPGTQEEEITWERLGGRIGYANPKDTFVYAPKRSE